MCDADSKWNGPPPRCEPVLCPPAPMIVNGGYMATNSNSNNTTMFGTIIEYDCDPGYEMVGEKFITCNIAGYWDGQPGYCIGMCNVLLWINKARQVKTKNGYCFFLMLS